MALLPAYLGRKGYFRPSILPIMLKKLQDKWKVSGWRLLLILATFALGGSATGYVGKVIMELTGISHPVLYIIIYVLVVTCVWPVMVMVVSIPLGQFLFFRNYLARMARKLSNRQNENPSP